MEPLTRVTFTAPGEPVAQPRQRFRIVAPRGQRPYVVPYQETDHPVHEFKRRVREAYIGAARRQLDIDPARDAVSMRVLAVFPVPPSRYRVTRRNDVAFMAIKPDIDNIVKAVADAMQGVAWPDDAVVAMLSAAKLEAMDATKARTEVTLEVVPRHIGIEELQRDLEFVL